MRRIDSFKEIADSSLYKMDMSQEFKLRLKNEINKGKGGSFKRIGFVGLPAVAALIAFMLLFTNVFSNKEIVKVYADDLMKEIKPQKVETIELDKKFLLSTADFSVELFRKAYAKDKNSLVSPTSVYLALGMTANGAEGNTLKELETLLGKRSISIKKLNSYYSTLVNSLTRLEKEKLNIANSIWYRADESLGINKDFLQINADYYNATAYKADFSSKNTVEDINNWVKGNTGKKIDKIVDQIDDRTIMYLINAVYFEDQWEKTYSKEDVRPDTFKLLDGTDKTVDFMHSLERGYLSDSKAQGFIKNYKNGKYSFVALLPNEGVSIDSYVTSLSGEAFLDLINNKTKEKVNAAIPKFKSEFEIGLVKPLKEMGLKECFDERAANFTKMGSSSQGNIYIGDILHKTFINVDEQGTKATAVTKVEVQLTSAEPTHNIILNRPFVYAIIDNETKLPLFIGTMMNPEI